MARPSKQDRQLQRVRDRLQSLLARGRSADAADALLAVPRAERDFALTAVASAMESEVAGAYAQAAQLTLVAWLTRTEREPRLLEVLGERAVATRYALFSAALRGRMWARAEALWSTLRPALAGHELFDAIEALVSSHGEPPGDVLARFESDARRLGYDASARPAAYPAPRELDEVEASCLRCFGSEPWPRFREVTLGWLRDAPAEHAQRLRVLCAELSEHELLLRSRGDGSHVAEVVRYVSTLAADAGAPSALESLVGSCLRVSYRALLGAAAPVPLLEALSTLAPLALRYESLRSSLATVILGAGLERTSRTRRAELLRVALAADPSPDRLLAVARELRGSEEEESEQFAAPSWFADVFEAALEDPASLAGALSSSLQASAASPSTSNSLRALMEILPVPIAVSMVDVLWGHANEPLRCALGSASDYLLVRMQSRPDVEHQFEELYELIVDAYPDLATAPRSEIRRLLNTELGAQVVEECLERIQGSGIGKSFEALAHKLTARVAPYNLQALEVAIQLAADGREEVRIVDAYLARLPTLLGRIRALTSAVCEDLDAAVELIEKRCCERLVPSAGDAASALTLLMHVDAPKRMCNRVARALLEAVEREPGALADREVARAVGLAKRRVKPRKTPVKRAAKARKRRRGVEPTLELDWTSAPGEVSRARG